MPAGSSETAPLTGGTSQSPAEQSRTAIAIAKDVIQIDLQKLANLSTGVIQASFLSGDSAGLKIVSLVDPLKRTASSAIASTNQRFYNHKADPEETATRQKTFQCVAAPVCTVIIVTGGYGAWSLLDKAFFDQHIAGIMIYAALKGIGLAPHSFISTQANLAISQGESTKALTLRVTRAGLMALLGWLSSKVWKPSPISMAVCDIAAATSAYCIGKTFIKPKPSPPPKDEMVDAAEAEKETKPPPEGATTTDRAIQSLSQSFSGLGVSGALLAQGLPTKIFDSANIAELMAYVPCYSFGLANAKGQLNKASEASKPEQRSRLVKAAGTNLAFNLAAAAVIIVLFPITQRYFLGDVDDETAAVGKNMVILNCANQVATGLHTTISFFTNQRSATTTATTHIHVLVMGLGGLALEALGSAFLGPLGPAAGQLVSNIAALGCLTAVVCNYFSEPDTVPPARSSPFYDAEASGVSPTASTTSATSGTASPVEK